MQRLRRLCWTWLRCTGLRRRRTWLQGLRELQGLRGLQKLRRLGRLRRLRLRLRRLGHRHHSPCAGRLLHVVGSLSSMLARYWRETIHDALADYEDVVAADAVRTENQLLQ